MMLCTAACSAGRPEMPSVTKAALTTTVVRGKRGNVCDFWSSGEGEGEGMGEDEGEGMGEGDGEGMAPGEGQATGWYEGEGEGMGEGEGEATGWYKPRLYSTSPNVVTAR